MLEKFINYPQLEITSGEKINKFFREIKNQYSVNALKEKLNDFKDLKILLIGDTIIDRYDYVIPKGRAIKDPILSCDFLSSEIYAGGILAIANHLSDFVDEIKLLTLIGDIDDNLDFIKDNIKPNVELEYFRKKNAYTTLKRRFINKQRNEKLFKVEKMSDFPISHELTDTIIKRILNIINKYDIVMVGDFGHGFINDKIISILEEKSKFLAVNVQTNSANLGFNYVTKYSTADFVSLDYRELQYAVQDQYGKQDVLLEKLRKQVDFRNILVTMGKKGVLYSNNSGNYFSPAFKTTVKDTIGAGDTVFSIASLLAYKKYEGNLLNFYSSCSGALAVQFMGNQMSLNKADLNKFIETILTNGD